VLRPGDAAPDFVLKDADGNDVRLSGFAGHPILLFFYPRDNTAGCTLEAKRLRDAAGAFAAHHAAVIGLSMDSVESHCDFRDRHNLPFTLLSDPEGRVHDLYSAWRTHLLGRRPIGVRRCSFLIDGDGIIRVVYKRVNPVSHAKQVLKDLERLEAQESWGKLAPPGGLKELLNR
jgi:peroxiredoxin Q/BCP